MRQALRRRSVVIGITTTAVLIITALVLVKDDSTSAELGMRPGGHDAIPIDPDLLPPQEEEGSPGFAPPEDANAEYPPPQTPPATTEAEALERAVEMAGLVTPRDVVGEHGCYRVSAGALAADLHAAIEAGTRDWKDPRFEQVPSDIRVWLCVVEIDAYGISTIVIHADPTPRHLEVALVGIVPSFLDLDTE